MTDWYWEIAPLNSSVLAFWDASSIEMPKVAFCNSSSMRSSVMSAGESESSLHRLSTVPYPNCSAQMP